MTSHFIWFCLAMVFIAVGTISCVNVGMSFEDVCDLLLIFAAIGIFAYKEIINDSNHNNSQITKYQNTGQSFHVQDDQELQMLDTLNDTPAKNVNTTYTKSIYSNQGEAHVQISQSQNQNGSSARTTDVTGQYIKDGKLHKMYHRDVVIGPNQQISHNRQQSNPYKYKNINPQYQYRPSQSREENGQWHKIRQVHHIDPHFKPRSTNTRSHALTDQAEKNVQNYY